jgi:hypothetical protein
MSIRILCLSKSSKWLFILVYLNLFSATAHGEFVGDLVIDRYECGRSTDGRYGAVNLTAFYRLDDAFYQQTCCTESDLRWIQRLTLSSSIPGLTPDPNRPFIDPWNPDQPPGGFDNLPFYDATYNNFTDIGNMSLWQRGRGPIMVDTPKVLISRAPVIAKFETLVVCVEDPMLMGILGGFEWGFIIRADGTVGCMLPTELTDFDLLETNFNQALAQDYDGWRIGAASALWPDMTLRLRFVPEPSGVILCCIGFLGLGFLSTPNNGRFRKRSV